MDRSPAATTLQLNRPLIGAISALLFAAAGVICLFVGPQNVWAGACLKIGLVTGALWLALPSLVRRTHFGEVSPSVLIGVLSFALFLTGKRVDFRIVLAILVGAAIATLILRPRSRTGSRTRS